MATTTQTMVQKADSPSLKRAFSPDLLPSPSIRARDTEQELPVCPLRHCSQPDILLCEPDTIGHWPSTRFGSPQRPHKTRRTSMPVQAGSRTAQMPSFMSVFGEEVRNTGLPGLTEGNSTASHGSHIARPASSGNIISGSNSTSVPFAAFHIHRDSTSTLASESSDSSPTTTISTMDSSSVTDPSPGPSPESPIARVTPSSFVPDFRSRKSENNSAENSPNTFFELQRPTTPAKKPRNLKNLGINTSTSLTNLRGPNPSASLPMLAKKEKNTSAPTSPSFIKPPTPPKRRPSNLSLTIQTSPGNDPKPMRLVIPSASALNRPALRHFQSSPSLPLCSPSAAPSGGMQLPPLRPLKTNPHGFAEVPIEMEEEEDQEPNFDIPQSREEKPAAYPHGPICIYESGVYLYFEPTAEQAANYDVIMNVASEVKNPFTSQSDSQEDLDARRKDGPPAETVDFAAIPEQTKPAPLDTESSSPTSPTTPKATPILEGSQEPEHQANGSFLKRPEYIHIPWEHNTDIVPDLYRLVKIIEDRVAQGKRVLIHCQCGVSRSASLIVAYGLYKNPGISVQEAYDAVKKRSKWIGPNMNLIMQLQEFRNGLLRANGDRAFHNQGYGLPLPRKSAGLPSSRSAGNNPLSPFERDVSSGSRTPHTAPLPEDNDMTMQRASTGNMISLSPGPLSAPSGVFFSPGFRRSWASSQTHFDLSPKSSPIVPISATPYVDPKGHVVPILSVTHSDPSGISVPLSLEPATQSQDQAQLKPLPVPNFSRPVKKLNEQDAVVEDMKPMQSPRSDVFHTAPLRPESFDGLQSPTASSFDIVAATSEDEYPTITTILSPRTFEFPSNLYPDDVHTPPSPRTMEPASGLSSDWEQPASTQLDAMSPTASSFPSDIFPAADDAVALDMASPRAAEFHMTPLRPRVQDEDPFHLASPRHFEFPRDVFEDTQHTLPRDSNVEARSHVQAILPPAHLDQPQSFNGFTSLNSTAQTHPTISVPSPELPSFSPLRIDSLSVPVDEPHTPDAPMVDREHGLSHTLPNAEGDHPIEQTTQTIRKTPERPLLTTPGRQASIKTRFSSPNMREQRKLHKIQTEMEALLPPRSPGLPHALDDIDALRSPRATEFTRNPFHVDLSSPVDEPSPVSSNETIKDGQDHREWRETFTWTPPRPISEDPRSPVQTNSSPIVRNIWDVL